MSKQHYDFAGYATKNDIRCSDGRTIKHGAFSADNGKRVPLVWNHQHDNVKNVLGHADLEERPDGVYAYCTFNNTEQGQDAKETVKHGDIVALSIFANQLKQNGGNVVHGAIREVSLVLAGANRGAVIDAVLSHGEISEDSAEIRFVGYDDLTLSHADYDDDEDEEDDDYEDDEYEDEDDYDEEDEEDDDEEDEELNHSDAPSGKSIAEIFRTLSDEQRRAVAVVIEQVLSDAKSEGALKHSEEIGDDETIEDVLDSLNDKQRKVVAYIIKKEIEKTNDSEGGSEMKHNAFEGSNYENTISHSDIKEVVRVSKQMGSLRAAVDQAYEEGVLAHADGDYGVNNMDYLFPDYKNITNTPEMIKRDMGWVDKIMNGVHKTPFKKVKSIFADITEDEARARGYIKGKFKKEQVFTLLKRTTDPQTIYVKQKLDKDDIEDLEENFSVLPWIKNEMQDMLKEEVARAILIGDARPSSSDDKIQENHIRPIYNDEDLFTVKVPVNVAANATEDDIARALIKAMVKARKQYKGTGNPDFYTTEDVLTDSILLENSLGERLYKSEAEVATAMRAKSVVTVEPMENKTITITEENGSSNAYPLLGVLVNIDDYNVGSKNGSKTDFFEDFDIDFNQQKYLYETRMSGALKKPFSAISFYLVKAN